MLSVDLSKALSHKFFVYLLALFPGFFFLLSVAMGNPQATRGVISRLEGLYPIPSYAMFLLVLGTGFFFGMTFVILSRLLELLLSGIFLLGWFTYRKLLARAAEMDTPDRKSVRWCLAAATEKLLERRYGIDAHRATGPNGGEWQVWYSVMGQPVKNIVESVYGARTAFASGLAGFAALCIAPDLAGRYYVSLCSILLVSGLWTSGYLYYLTKHPMGRDFLRLKAVIAELHEMPIATHEPNPADRLTLGKS